MKQTGPDMTQLESLQQLKQQAAADLQQIETKASLYKRFLDLMDELTELVEKLEQTGTKSNHKADRNSKKIVVPIGSLAGKIAHVLQEADKPMRARDIARILHAAGVKTDSAKGLLPMVLSALVRRKDLFVKVSRGVYTVAKEGE